MPHCLTTARTVQRTDVVTRFDPRFWTVNFPRPMMAAVTTAAADALRVDAVFYRANDLAGLIWEAEDRWDHPLLRYDTDRDFRRCRLSFRWRSAGVLPLDAVNGPTLTVEGRDENGVARAWYPPGRQHYLSGFVLRPEDAASAWTPIEAAAAAAQARGVAETFLWALPQVMRDGLVRWDAEGDDMEAFDDVLFPLALGREAEVAPTFSTAILTGAGGAEQRNAGWAEARTSYDVGPGIRSQADIATLLGFFRARMGPARGFRLRDPFDSVGVDEAIGVGDGAARRFALVRGYGDATRRITRPVAGSVSVKLAGVATAAFGVEAGGWIAFDTPPPAGVAVTASFAFDVPVRFAEDRLSVTRQTFLTGNAASVPLIEVREA